MSKTTIDQSDRRKIVADALGNLHIENLKPSDTLMSGLESYIVGKKTTSDLLNDIKSKYSNLNKS